MSLSTTITRVQLVTNGSQKIFSFPYLFLETTHLVVITTIGGVDSTKALGSDYSVTGAGVPAGGTVVFGSAPATGAVTISRVVPLTQLTDYVANDNFPAETHERALDKLTMASQQTNEILTRSFAFPITDTVTHSGIVPSETTRAGKLLSFDATGSLVVVDPAAIVVPPSTITFTVFMPFFTDTTQNIAIKANGTSQRYNVRAWIVDNANTIPTLTRSTVLPSGNATAELNQLTSGSVSVSPWGVNVAVLTLINSGAAANWKICFEVDNIVTMTTSISVGV